MTSVCLFQAFGNHEFDNGVDGLMKPFLQDIKCPIVSANLKTDRTLAPTFGTTYTSYRILNVSNEQVGIVGYTSRETPALSESGEGDWFVLCLTSFTQSSSLLTLHKI